MKIYTLHDPDTLAVRYVGFTSKPLDERIDGHIRRSKWEKCHRANWIRSITNRGEKPVILLVENVSPENWQERERFWIKHFRDTMGCDLVNSCDGGEGAPNPSNEVREKIRAAHLGKVVTEETRSKLRTAGLGRKHSDKTRSKMRLASLGRKHTAEARAKISAAKIGKKMTEEHRAKLRAIRVGTSPSAEAHAKSCEVNRRPVIEIATGIAFPSLAAASQSIGVSDTTIIRWIRLGKFAYQKKIFA